MRNKTCCFTGHREIGVIDNFLLKIKIYINSKKLIKKGVVNFITGGARGFDTLAALTILKLKKRYQNIKLILVLPCLNQTKYWNTLEKNKYNYIKEKANEIKILSSNYYHGCMHKRNRYLIDNSSYCICYKRKETGGTAYTINYAQKNGLIIIPL